MVRSDKGRWAVVSPMDNRKTFYYLCFAHRRFSNVPLANVLSRFSLTKRSESYTYIYLVFSAITQKRPIHVCYCTHCRWSGERSWRTDLAWYDGETICWRSDRESKGEAFHEIKTSSSYPFMWFFFFLNELTVFANLCLLRFQSCVTTPLSLCSNKIPLVVFLLR